MEQLGVLILLPSLKIIQSIAGLLLPLPPPYIPSCAFVSLSNVVSVYQSILLDGEGHIKERVSNPCWGHTCLECLRLKWIIFPRTAMISERGWRSGENANLPPLWPGFDSWIWWYVSVAVVVGSRPCFVGFPTEPPVLLSRKTNILIFFYLSSENDQLGESQYESVNQVEAAKLLGSPNSKSNTRLQPPPENCECAVVNKANKKVSI